jgi:REP element-mobilizing transposase RayT
MTDNPTNRVVFNTLDREAEIEILERNLPHWFQVGAAVFVTMRAADSLPKEVLLRMVSELRQWLRHQGLPSQLADHFLQPKTVMDDQLIEQLSATQIREFKRLSDQLFHRSLDNCHGACLFKRSDVAEIVTSAIRKFDGDRYDLDCLVIMPNHAHAIVQFRAGFKFNVIGQSWMRYTAREINKHLGRSGVLWQPEPFDHIIRSADQFKYLQAYIANNPQKAKLKAGEFVYWNRSM